MNLEAKGSTCCDPDATVSASVTFLEAKVDRGITVVRKSHAPR